MRVRRGAARCIGSSTFFFYIRGTSKMRYGMIAHTHEAWVYVAAVAAIVATGVCRP